ncbi:MAG TPA: mechanosensitive ion channel domain-containing protein [Burkholderiaceae bacterium]|nr:mechanosensitive ion channel domain-containing protein [Burkholderiaceae bacterium]
MRLPSKAPRLNFALLGVVLLVAGAAVSAAEPLLAPAGAGESPARASAAGVAAPAQGATPPSLAEIVTALEALDATEGDIGKRLADAARLDAQRTEIDDEETALASVRHPGADASLGLVELFALTDLTAMLGASDRRLTTTIETLSAKTKAFDADLDRLAAYDADAARWLQAARARNAPPALIVRIADVPARNERLAHDLREKRDRALELLSRAIRLSARASGLRSQVSDRRLQLEAQMRGARTEPLWRLDTHGVTIARASQIARAEVSHVTDFLVAHSARLATIAVAAFALAVMLVVAARKQFVTGEESFEGETPRLFGAPVTAAIMLALLTLAWLGPAAPAYYYQVLLSLMLIPAALLARALFARQGSLSLLMLIAAMVSLGVVGPIVDPLPLQGRLLLIAQCIAVGAGLSVDLRRGALTGAVRWSPVTTRRVALTAIVLLIVAVLAAVAGYAGPARVLRNAVLGAAGLGLLIVVATQLLYELVAALSETRVAQRLRIVRHDPAAVRRVALTALRVAGWIAWVAGMLVLVGRLDWVVQLTENVVDTKFKIGVATVSTAAIFAGLAVLAGTYVLVKSLRLVLDIELLPRLSLEHGVAFAVSAMIRYCLITAGALLAMAAMGIDLTKVTLLAGAIGVGVGLGLQGVVTNFVSGLVLLVERPISAGDAVQIGDSSGVVQSIGVRSSMIRTSQGAEVIVPNADLISKVVTNWTLSDRKRRVEIDVGVARETAPEKVIHLLETTAAGVEGIIAKPAPRARLSGLGADPTYRLYAWIDDIDRSSEIQGAVRMAIAKKFSDAGIEIK